MSNVITNPSDAKAFLRAGNAKFTIKSLKTGKHYTYSIKAPWKNGRFDYDASVRFVKLLVDGDQWIYIGSWFADTPWLGAGAKGNPDHPAFKALDWVIGQINLAINHERDMPVELELWHEGTCGRCGRSLTNPESIANGIGPECANKVGGM